MTTPPVPALSTLAVHAGRAGLTELGVHALPIDLSTTAPLDSIDAGGLAYDTLRVPDTRCRRACRRSTGGPGTRRWRASRTRSLPWRLLSAADDGAAPEAVAFASGMAAMSAVLLSRVSVGLPHVVAVRPLYGGTDHLLATGLLGTTGDATASPDEVAAAVRPDTGLVVVESPANPTLELHDIRAIVGAAGDVPVLVDNTFATPVLQQPLALGATYVMHSATKYIGGHGDAMGGVVVTDPEHAAALRPIRTITGGVLDPWSAYLLHRGLPTLPLRVREQQRTAGLVAAWLAEHPQVARVFYPGLPGQDPLGLIGSQMRRPGRDGLLRAERWLRCRRRRRAPGCG